MHKITSNTKLTSWQDQYLISALWQFDDIDVFRKVVLVHPLKRRSANFGLSNSISDHGSHIVLIYVQWLVSTKGYQFFYLLHSLVSESTVVSHDLTWHFTMHYLYLLYVWSSPLFTLKIFDIFKWQQFTSTLCGIQHPIL